MGLSTCWTIGKWGDPRENGAKPTNFVQTCAAEALDIAKSVQLSGASLRSIKNATVYYTGAEVRDMIYHMGSRGVL